MCAYPKVGKAMEKRQEVYNETIAYIRRLETEGKALVIRPPKALEIGRVEHDPERMRAVYEMGRAEGETKLDAMKAFSKWDGKEENE